MHLSIDLFNPTWCKTLMVSVSLRKVDILFSVSVLSKGFFDNIEDRHAYMQVIKEYFADDGDEMEGEVENEDSTCRLPRISVINVQCIQREFY